MQTMWSYSREYILCTRACAYEKTKGNSPWGHHVICLEILLLSTEIDPKEPINIVPLTYSFSFPFLFAQTLKKQDSYLKDQLSVYKGTSW